MARFCCYWIDQKGQLVELVHGNIPFAREEQQKPLREKKDITVQGKEKPRKKKIDEESDSSFLNQVSSFQRNEYWFFASCQVD